MSGESADVILRNLGNTLPEHHMATEEEIRKAFYECGYGSKAVDKWWKLYRAIEFIMPVSKSGVRLTNDDGYQLYTTIYWLPPAVVRND